MKGVNNMKKTLNIILSLFLITTFALADDGDFGSSGDYSVDPVAETRYSTESEIPTERWSSTEELRSSSEPTRETREYSGYSGVHSTTASSSSGSSFSLADAYVSYKILNWLFDDGTKNQAPQSVSSQPSSTRRGTRQAQVSGPDPIEIFREMGKSSMPLSDSFSDGRKEATIAETTIIFNGYKSDGITQRDREIAVESLLRLIALNPMYSTIEGPIGGRLFPVTQEVHKALVQKTKLPYLIQTLGIENKDSITIMAHQAKYAAATSQFILAMSLYSQALREKVEISAVSQEAMRASFYALAFELNKIKVSEDLRSKLASGFVTQVGEVAPEMIHRMSGLFANPQQLEALRNGLYKNISANEPVNKESHWKSRTASVAAGAAVFAAWFAGGSSAVDMVSSHVGIQNLSFAAGALTLPVVGYVATKIGIKRWNTLRMPMPQTVFGTTENVFSNSIKENTNSCLKFYKH